MRIELWDVQIFRNCWTLNQNHPLWIQSTLYFCRRGTAIDSEVGTYPPVTNCTWWLCTIHDTPQDPFFVASVRYRLVCWGGGSALGFFCILPSRWGGWHLAGFCLIVILLSGVVGPLYYCWDIQSWWPFLVAMGCCQGMSQLWLHSNYSQPCLTHPSPILTWDIRQHTKNCQNGSTWAPWETVTVLTFLFHLCHLFIAI